MQVSSVGRVARRRLPAPVVGAVATARRQLRWLRPVGPAPGFPPVPTAPVRLLVGPTNSAGQGWAWARSAERAGAGATCFAVRRNSFGFADDYGAPIPVYAHPRWQRAQERYVLGGYTHMLVESMRPLFGGRHGRDARGDLDVIVRAGLAAGLAFHGSDVRLPSAHAAAERWSPFHVRDELTERLEAQARLAADVVADFDGPVFVSTPDLLTYLPGATWLPVVVDVDRWATAAPVLQRERPLVVHAPSNPRFKGTEAVEAAMALLVADGLIEYRRLEGVPNDRMPAALADADVVVDQLVMGLYGVGACEAMAAGRVVVSYVGDDVRARVRSATGLELPVAEAGPQTLADVVAGIVAGRDGARELAAGGPRFVRSVHDGSRSAAALAGWLFPPPD
ncbi:hypothetical protein [Jiangella asiatica]|uniref:Glycosyltransferase family 1 protein n=1 Tax=Jiangella asiatica TaxID=2530372 RepID=A0A4R5DU95_9ACTN|nr:hypothetical protein [Jiangella asiatica]TDE15890.1 hypothetical protein E1269_00940 [Jiangella asiatica]